MRSRTLRWAFLSAFLLAQSVIGQSQWPTRSWPSSTPRAVGLDPKALADLDADIAAGKDGSRTAWGGSGFGGQRPIVFPECDLLVVFTGWNILPDKPSLTPRVAIDRILEAVVDRK